jgi:hypothetical protein
MILFNLKKYNQSNYVNYQKIFNYHKAHEYLKPALINFMKWEILIIIVLCILATFIILIILIYKFN